MNEYFIKEIEIKNFKCFEDFKADGFGRVNLIGGKNNVGKTAFMEACYLGESANGVQNKKIFFHALLVVELNRNPLMELEIIQDSSNFQFNFEESIIAINDKIKSVPNFFMNTNLYKAPLGKFSSKGIREIEEIKEFYQGNNKLLNIQNSTFISMCNMRHNFIIECIDELKLKNKIEDINILLKENFHIDSIDIIKNTVMIKDKNIHYPIYEYGDGLKHFISILISLFVNKDSIIFLDEIENGIHYSNLDKLWEIILTVSKEQNVQVFATTHSKECIESYARVAKRLEDEDVKFLSLYKNRESELKSITLNYQDIQDRIELGLDNR